jgi:acyl-coenzyme A synthetase/AMP-(fatty) acid ligase
MIFRRRRRTEATPVWGPQWDVPARFDLVRDVLEPRGRDIAARAVTYVDEEGIVDRRTVREVAQDAARWAQALRRREAAPGAAVVIATGNVPDTVLALLGTLKAGHVAVPVGADLGAAEMAHRLRAVQARILIASRDAEEKVQTALAQVPGAPSVVYLDDASRELRRYSPSAPTEERALADPALVLFTAGVTDEAKAVVHTPAGLWAARAATEHWLGADDRDLVWSTARAGSPEWLWHGVLGPLAVGAEIVLHDGAFDAAERLGLLQRLAVTVLCQPPTEYRALAATGLVRSGLLPRLRATVATGEPLDEELVERYLDDAGLALRDGLTQAECSLLAATLADMAARPGVLGVGLPGHELAVISPEGHVLGPGEEGELGMLGRPPTLFVEYLGSRDATAAAFRDGWYLTGDRCVLAEDGSLRFARRGDDLIVAAGARIGPTDVENALRSHPLIQDAAAVPAHDPERGTVLKAFVTLTPGATAPPDLTAVLAAHVTGVAAAQLAPAEVEVLAELPRASTGTIRRGELRRLEQDRAREAAAAAERRAREEAEAAEAERARWLAEREEERKRDQAEERARAEAERQRILAEKEQRKRDERAEREVKERDAKERAAAERAERERLERERKETERAGREAAKQAEQARKAQERAEREASAERERAEREAADLAEDERRRAEQAARQAAAEQKRAERESAASAERAEAERRRQEEEAERAAVEAREREAAAQRETEAQRAHDERAEAARAQSEAAVQAQPQRVTPADPEELARQAEAEARRKAEVERAEVEALERANAERAERERQERERRERERAEREASRREAEARRLAEERRQAEERQAEERRQAEEERRRADAEAASAAEQRRAADAPVATIEQPGSATAGGEDEISGIAERIRRYSNPEEPDDERPFGWRRVETGDDDE